MKTKPTLIAIIILLIATFFGGYKCGSSKEPVPEKSNKEIRDSFNVVYSALQEAKQAKDVEYAKLDSTHKQLKASKVIYTTRYVQAKDNRVYINSDSLTCIALFDELARSCDSVNLVNDSLIIVLEQKDSTLQNIVEIQEKQLAIKDTTNQLLTESLVKSEAKVEKLQKKVKRNRVIAAISAGVAVVMGLF